ncbi:MAG TPA: hypothetical protein VHT53_02755 [Candidatus Elarobacter sp.]|jgi:hypothetical protein|nr:hypothetical protein [Candidatus Elarobacter sp.]
MKSARRALATSARVFAGLCAVVALLAPGASPPAVAQAGVPIATLTLAERRQTAPGTTVVHIGSRTTTLAALRAAHVAREAALARASAVGTLVHNKGVATAEKMRPAGRMQIGPQPFTEPPSQYASAPGDMRAFCAAARASACLFLPPDQQVTVLSSGVSDWDGMIDQQQCAQEGGNWEGMWNAYFCAFAYPEAVTVHFPPAANFTFSQSATCDSSTFAYNVDSHGAVSIHMIVVPPVIITTHPGTFCAVTVTPGG